MLAGLKIVFPFNMLNDSTWFLFSPHSAGKLTDMDSGPK